MSKQNIRILNRRWSTFAWIGLTLILVSGLSLTGLNWPAEQASITLAMPQVTRADGSVLTDTRELLITWPVSTWLGDRAPVTLTLISDNAESNFPYETYNPVLEARVDFNAGITLPDGTLNMPLPEGRSVQANWGLKALEPGTAEATVWTYLQLVPKSGGDIERYLLVSRPIQLETKSVLGFGGLFARWLSGFIALLGCILLVLSRKGVKNK